MNRFSFLYGAAFLGAVLLGRDPLAAQPFSSEGVILLDWLPLSEFGGLLDDGNDCWGYVSPAGREYAIFGHDHGTAFVEVTDPKNARLIDQVDGPTSLTRDIKVYQDYAYAVSDGGGGIQVIDLSGLDNGVATVVGNVTAGGEFTHNVAIDTTSGFLYRCDDPLVIYSLADPANPSLVGSWAGSGFVHDLQVVTYTSGPYSGREVAFCCAPDPSALDIVDVTDKRNPFLIRRVLYQDAGYPHQGWLSEDRRYFYLNDEFNEINTGLRTTTIVIDVSDLDNAFEAGTFTNGNSAIDHNLYVRGDLIFEANYTSGLRVFDAGSDPLHPVETAFFDTYPEDDDLLFHGLWSVFPFFPSGIVIGSDRDRGLFVWELAASGAVDFIRGDANADADFNGLSDGLYILAFQFQAGAPIPPCLEAADADGNGVVNGLADAIYVLGHQFQSGPPPPPPYPECGPDPDPALTVGCTAHPGC